jgi:hypothetical protein
MEEHFILTIKLCGFVTGMANHNPNCKSFRYDNDNKNLKRFTTILIHSI